MKKVYKFSKGNFVTVKKFVEAKYIADVQDGFELIIHEPEENHGSSKKVLVSRENTQNEKFLVVGVKQIKTGYYYRAVAPTSNWTGSDEGEPASFFADKCHDVYVLEIANTQVWRTLVCALEQDMELTG